MQRSCEGPELLATGPSPSIVDGHPGFRESTKPASRAGNKQRPLHDDNSMEFPGASDPILKLISPAHPSPCLHEKLDPRFHAQDCAGSATFRDLVSADLRPRPLSSAACIEGLGNHY